MPAVHQDRLLACELLKAADDCVAIERVEFDQARASAADFGGDQRGARTGEGIEDELATPCAVAKCISDQCHWLRGRMPRMILARGPQAADAGIVPHIRAIPAGVS